MRYGLIAFDMDGTLLDSSKRVLPSSSEAIERAIAAGRSVAICSGRCPSMIKRDRYQFPAVRYAICSSGSVLFDLDRDEVIYEAALPYDLTWRILDAASSEDFIFEVFRGEGFLYQEGDLALMESHHMGIYEGLYRETGTPVEDLLGYLRDPGHAIQKLNMHFDSREARERVREALLDEDVEMVESEHSSLEFSPTGVNKGTGLLALADLLGIDHAATIAVGDADNDLPVLRVAGLSVAMGNANDNAKALADVIVADNDSGGCAEVIDRFLLGDER